jgi:CRISPR-associated protein Csx17
MPGVLLAGCRPEPMSGFLRALAVFRLVSEQADPASQGHWTQHGFCLESVFDEAQLIEFFLHRYQPTPIVAPWNFGSGFYEGDKTDGITAICGTDDVRFGDYRDTIHSVRGFPEMPSGEISLRQMLERVEAEAANKTGKQQTDLLKLIDDARAALAEMRDESFLGLSVDGIKARKAKTLAKAAGKLRSAAKRIAKAGAKEQIVLACRNSLCDRAVDWLDAAAVLSSESKADWPPIAGTGGNEGRLDYTNSFMERVAGLLIRAEPDSPALLRNALFAEPVSGLKPGAVGQYEPGRAGGSNQGQGIESKDFPANPWSFVLAMEGIVAWASGVGRRQSPSSVRRACSPFTVDARAVGYGSAADADETGARAEIWMPLWSRPCGFEELRYVLREGRAEIGGRPAKDGLQFAEAAASLGVDRGISGFVRYSLLKRRGDSYVALPAGHFDVEDRREVDLIQELDPIVDVLDQYRAKAGNAAAAQFLSLRRAIDEAIYEVLLHGRPRMIGLVAALGRMERYLALLGDRGLQKPIAQRLSSRWLEKANDGSVEFRVAAALASIGPSGEVGPLRANLTPVDPGKPWIWAKGSNQRTWAGVDFYTRIAGVLRRRVMDAERLRCEENPLWARVMVSRADVARFLAGDVNQELVENLLFGFTWVDWSQDIPALGRARDVDGVLLPRSWVILKWLFLPGKDIRAEKGIVPLLCAGRIAEACEVAQRRLRCAGQMPRRIRFEDGSDGVRLAAALLLPLPGVKELEYKTLFHTQEDKHV